MDFSLYFTYFSVRSKWFRHLPVNIESQYIFSESSEAIQSKVYKYNSENYNIHIFRKETKRNNAVMNGN